MSRIKARARTEVELGRDVLADLHALQCVGIEGQVEVAVLQHDPSGWPLGHDELVARRRGRSI